MAIVADMTITQAITSPGQGALLLMEEVSALVDACAAKASARATATTTTATRDTHQASVLVRASLTALTKTADQQARAALPATGRNHGNDKEDTMPTSPTKTNSWPT
jgi:hypothetical protein